MPLIQEQFFDIGANLTHKSFDKDLEFVITEASETGVKATIYYEKYFRRQQEGI